MQWLSDRTAELGHQISRSRISDLERGDRGGLLGIAEVMILAEALQVPPIQLIYPDLPEGECEYLPGATTMSWHALQWFTGEADQPVAAGAPNYHLSLMRELAKSAWTIVDRMAEVETAEHHAAVGAYEAADIRVKFEAGAANEAQLTTAINHADVLQYQVQAAEERLAEARRRAALTKQILKDAGFTIEIGEDQ